MKCIDKINVFLYLEKKAKLFRLFRLCIIFQENSIVLKLLDEDATADNKEYQLGSTTLQGACARYRM